MAPSSPFSPQSFFDLGSFSHKEVFTHCEFVWQALSNVEKYITSQKVGYIEISLKEGVYLENPELISIGKGTVVEPGSYIRGPCLIGKNCQIRHGAYIRGNVLIGDECVVGHATELKHSILLNHAKAAHFAFVGDSILGNNVNLGAGVKCANLRLDGKPVEIRQLESFLSTGLRKLGAIIGDSCQIGCNVVLNPGTLFGKGSNCYPNLTVGGVIPEQKLVRPQTKQFVMNDL